MIKHNNKAFKLFKKEYLNGILVLGYCYDMELEQTLISKRHLNYIRKQQIRNNIVQPHV